MNEAWIYFGTALRLISTSESCSVVVVEDLLFLRLISNDILAEFEVRRFGRATSSFYM